jgi:hypothetical protein
MDTMARQMRYTYSYKLTKRRRPINRDFDTLVMIQIDKHVPIAQR